MNIVAGLEHAWPDAIWTLDGEEYAGLTWLSDSPMPTEQEIAKAADDAAIQAQIKAEAENQAVQAAVEHAKSLGFTDAMISVMYPNLGAGNE